VVNLDVLLGEFPHMAIPDKSLGTVDAVFARDEARPNGILRPSPETPPAQNPPITNTVMGLWRLRAGMTYLSPAPLCMRLRRWGSR
jgi:long-chain acyl-CoA synthetase